MHFNIYLDDDTGLRLGAAAEQGGETRNALIRRAVREWLNRQSQPMWPEAVLAHEGMADLPPFETGREELRAPAEDPLA